MSEPNPSGPARVEGLACRPLDRRRVDVAVDLAGGPCALDVELVIVGPADDELCCLRLIRNTSPEVDKVMHLRRDAEPGPHTLHVGLFDGDRLVARAARSFEFPVGGAA